jgi:RNA polymerase primary sigma factor
MRNEAEKRILSLYLNEANRYRVLTREEERLASKDDLVKHNLCFAMQVARSYMGSGMELEDLIAEANAGLIEASKRWDPDRGVRFISFAVDWIRQSIITSLNRHTRLVRLPANQLKDMRKQDGKITAENRVSFSDPVSPDGGDERTLEDTIGLDSEIEVETDTTHLKFLIGKAINKLPSVHQEIIKLRFSIDTDYEMSSEDLAEKFGYTKTRINQIIRQGLSKMKDDLKAR